MACRPGCDGAVGGHSAVVPPSVVVTLMVVMLLVVLAGRWVAWSSLSRQGSRGVNGVVTAGGCAAAAGQGQAAGLPALAGPAGPRRLAGPEPAQPVPQGREHRERS
jgi:hypothetical protein